MRSSEPEVDNEFVKIAQATPGWSAYLVCLFDRFYAQSTIGMLLEKKV